MQYHFSRSLKSFLVFLLFMIGLRVFSQDDPYSFLVLSSARDWAPVCKEIVNMPNSTCTEQNKYAFQDGFYYIINKHPNKSIYVEIKYPFEWRFKGLDSETGEEGGILKLKPGSKNFLLCQSLTDDVSSKTFWWPRVEYAEFME